MDYGRINSIIWLVFLAYWLICWAGNKKTVQRANPAGRMTAAAVTIGLVWVLYWHKGLDPDGWLMRRLWPGSDPVETLGSVCCAAGVGIAIWARYILGRNWSANPTVKEGHELITRGPYRFVRHPIYTGILLALLGSLVIADGRPRSLLMYAIIVIGLHFKLRIEEGFMMQTFPTQYPEYRRRTKAIIPFVL